MTERSRPFRQVDVFTAQPYLGNALAVVLDGADLSQAQMQQFARWTNLSETTFVLPASNPDADYRVRIFTPGGELPFAGHPTLGTCHAWLQAGGKPRAEAQIVQECQAGLVRIRRQDNRLAFAAPPLKRAEPPAALLAKVAGALGLSAGQIMGAQQLDNGPHWLGLLLDSVETVLQLSVDHAALRNMGQKVGVAAVRPSDSASVLIARSNREARALQSDLTFAPEAWPEPDEPLLEVRAFAAPIDILEDPVTGSLNASLAQWLIAEGRLPRAYVAAQGQCLGRDGRVHLAQDESGQVWVGGDCVTCIEGSVTL